MQLPLEDQFPNSFSELKIDISKYFCLLKYCNFDHYNGYIKGQNKFLLAIPVGSVQTPQVCGHLALIPG